MAVTFDTVGAGGTANSTSGASWSHTIGSSATALVVAVGAYYPGAGYTSMTTRTVTVGTTPLVLLGVVNGDNVASWGWVELWGVINPPTGARTVTVVENNSTTPAYLYGNSVSYTGVSQFGTPVTNFGTAATITSGAIASATGNMVVSAQGGYDATLTAPSGTSRYDQPSPATGNYTTLLIQDGAGTATVTQTSTFSGPLGWGDVSVNLIAGSQRHVNASLAMTASPSGGASFVGRTWHVNASLAMTTTASATATALPLGPPLRYVGRPPDSDSVLATAAYVQAAQAATLVTPAWVTQQVTAASANLVTEAWVNQQVANYATQGQVTTALGAYVPTSELGAHSGIAQLNSSDQIPTAQLPTALVTNSLAANYDAATSGTIWLPTNTTALATNNTIGQVPLASVTIPNPGYPWIPLPFASVLGQAGGSGSGSRLLGNNNIGFLAVTPAGATSPVYASGVCTADSLPNNYLCLPYGAATGPMTPLTQRPIVGGATLTLSGCCWSGNNYIFSGTDLVFFVLVLPAMGG